jgi:TPR repeat protein
MAKVFNSTMSQRLVLGLVLALLVALPTAAQDFQKGWAAYKRGDYTAVLTEWRPLAERGHASAQINLGVIYGTGYGVPRDNAEAVKWYSKAAAQGNANAQYSLGLMHFKGRGVAQDLVLAHLWFSLSAAKGNKHSSESRDLAAKRMSPAQLAEARKLARTWRVEHKKK